jgi:hypothetical protein
VELSHVVIQNFIFSHASQTNGTVLHFTIRNNYEEASLWLLKEHKDKIDIQATDKVNVLYYLFNQDF